MRDEIVVLARRLLVSVFGRPNGPQLRWVAFTLEVIDTLQRQLYPKCIWLRLPSSEPSIQRGDRHCLALREILIWARVPAALADAENGSRTWLFVDTEFAQFGFTQILALPLSLFFKRLATFVLRTFEFGGFKKSEHDIEKHIGRRSLI
jgi:hypothetical protein